MPVETISSDAVALLQLLQDYRHSDPEGMHPRDLSFAFDGLNLSTSLPLLMKELDGAGLANTTSKGLYLLTAAGIRLLEQIAGRSV